MPVFRPTLAVDVFAGAGLSDDVIDFRTNQTGGVTVEFDAVDGEFDGSFNTAAGDTYSGIGTFRLTDLAAETDVFVGSDLGEVIRGYAGSNRIDGAGGNDVITGGDDRNILTGGTGLDEMTGGASLDRFLVAAGDTEAGERYIGQGGDDSIRLVEGGTGTEVDLSQSTVTGVEFINFDTGSIDLTVASITLDEALVSGSADDNQTVTVDGWVTRSNNAAPDLDTAFDMLDSGVEEVLWQYDTADADQTSVIKQTVVGGDRDGEEEYVETFNDDIDSRGVASEQKFYNENRELFQTITTADNGRQVIEEFDPATGNLLTETIFDLSDNGDLLNYNFRQVQYDGNGAIEFIDTNFDNGLQEEQSFDIATGDLIFRRLVDVSPGDDFRFDTIEESYQDLGNGLQLAFRTTVNDATEFTASLTEVFDANGSLERTVEAFQAGFTMVIGNGTDQSFAGTDADEIFFGAGGTDTFVFSGDTGNDVVNGFGAEATDLIDLTAYGIGSFDDLNAAGAVSFDDPSGAIIDIAALGTGNTGEILLRGMDVLTLGNEDFVDLPIA